MGDIVLVWYLVFRLICGVGLVVDLRVRWGWCWLYLDGGFGFVGSLGLFVVVIGVV